MSEQDEMEQVQRLVTEHPIIKSFLLHRLSNILMPVGNYADLIDHPDTTEAQRQKYCANIKACSERAFQFLRDCGVDHEFKR